MNILLTGVSKGLGLDIAEVLLNKGHIVYGISRSKTNELSDLIDKFPENLKYLKYDLRDSQNLRGKIFKEFIGTKTPIHGYINNAAMAYDDIVTNLFIDPLKSMFDVNVLTPIMLTKHVIRSMLLNNVKGSIVHISSISVHTGYKGLSVYAASKGALEAFSKNCAREWGGKGIRSNCIVAGFMETNMSSTLSDDQKNRIYKRTSLKKATTLSSVSNMCSLLLSNDAVSVTGQNIFVDSGTI